MPAVAFPDILWLPLLHQVFLTHLHSDHIADLATFYVGAMFGRTRPWHVWGPSGEDASTGTAHAIEGLRQVHCLSLCAAPGGLLGEVDVTCCGCAPARSR